MCFSATASFTAGAILLGVGASTWRMAPRASDQPLAAIPALFGLQQLVEGLIWIGLADDGSEFSSLVTAIYAFFSHVLWPVYVPFATWLAESQRGRRRALAAALVCGVVLGTYILARLSGDPLVAHARGGHLEYFNRDTFGPAVMLPYLAITTGSLTLSSRPYIRLFGLLTVGAFLVAYAIYATWLISVWCFFAAALSAIVWLHFAARPVPTPAGPPGPHAYGWHSPL